MAGQSIQENQYPIGIASINRSQIQSMHHFTFLLIFACALLCGLQCLLHSLNFSRIPWMDHNLLIIIILRMTSSVGLWAVRLLAAPFSRLIGVPCSHTIYELAGSTLPGVCSDLAPSAFAQFSVWNALGRVLAASWGWGAWVQLSQS